MKGLVAFSFALGRKEPNPCNIRLTHAVSRIVGEEGEPVIVVPQWEIALTAPPSLTIPHVVREHRQAGEYLDSKEVMAQAAEVFRPLGITEVIPVANPFIHLLQCRILVRQFGFIPVKRKIGWIGFYHDSLQWWTRGPLETTFYSALVVVTGRRGR